MIFHQKKFLSFPLERQHKKLAELLREVYLGRISLENYQRCADWLAIPAISANSPQSLSDRYHYHLEMAGQFHKEHNLLPQVRKGDRETGCPPLPIDIYLDHIRSAHNVGSILRTVEAFRLGTVHFSYQTPFVDNKKVKDAAMGCEEWIPAHANAKLGTLRGPIVILETCDSAVPIHEFVFPESFTLVVGNEEYGVSEEVLALADHFVEIPLRGKKNSLNVANAFAIAASWVACGSRRTEQ